MKNPIERKRTEYVCGNIVMNSGTTAITGFTVQDDEDYKISDAWIVSTANTEYPLENKTIKGGFNFKENGQWRTYFTRDIYSKLNFEHDVTTGTPVYFVNAEDKYGNMENGKWQKLLKDDKSCLSFLAADGVVLFSHKSMVKAFVGFATYYTPHTTEFGNKGPRKMERKAVLDLSQGLFIPCSTPTNLI